MRLFRSAFTFEIMLVSLFIAPQMVLMEVSPYAASAQTKSAEVFPVKSWSHASAQLEAPWSKEKLAAAHAYADSIHSSAVMIVQGGAVIDEWGDIDKKIDAYSIRKSLLSALYGVYSAEGVIDVNQTLEQLGIDDSPDPLTKAEKQARVVDLLRARSASITR